MFCKKDVLKNVAKFTGKHLCESFFLNKVVSESLAQLFSYELCEIVKNTFFYRTPPVVASVCSFFVSSWLRGKRHIQNRFKHLRQSSSWKCSMTKTSVYEINPFLTNIPISYPLKTPKNIENIGKKWVNWPELFHKEFFFKYFLV